MFLRSGKSSLRFSAPFDREGGSGHFVDIQDAADGEHVPMHAIPLGELQILVPRRRRGVGRAARHGARAWRHDDCRARMTRHLAVRQCRPVEGRRFPKGRCLVPASHFFEFTGSEVAEVKMEVYQSRRGVVLLRRSLATHARWERRCLHASDSDSSRRAPTIPVVILERADCSPRARGSPSKVVDCHDRHCAYLIEPV